MTILGHVQRGGAPSAFDRSMSSILGSAAVEEVLAATADSVPQLIGMQGNRVSQVPLMDCVAQTRELADLIAAKDYDTALTMRGDSYTEMVHVFHSISHALPDTRPKDPSPAPDRVAQRRRPRPRDERRRPGGGAARPAPRAHHARRRRQLPRPGRRATSGSCSGATSRAGPGAGGAELGISRRRPDGQGPLRDRPRPGAARHRRPADHRRLGRLRVGRTPCTPSATATRRSRSR